MFAGLVGLRRFSSAPKPIGIYVHFPYCRKRCPYCAFNVYVPKDLKAMPLGQIADAWKRQFLNDVKKYSLDSRNYVASVYFGGGTPSLADERHIGDFIKLVRDNMQIAPDCEISLEVNPSSAGDGDVSKFNYLKSVGVNRVSIGVQSIRKENLLFLGRDHSENQALDTIKLASSLFDRVSVDMMYGLPKQSVLEWEKELKEFLQMLPQNVNHASLYNLNIETGTNFYWKVREGSMKMPDEDESADFYEKTLEAASIIGFSQYEVSSFYRNGDYSKHNLNTWRGYDYMGIGPGAHGRITVEPTKKRLALRQKPTPKAWMESIESGGESTAEVTTLNGDQIGQELVIAGLRPSEGVSKARFHELAGKSVDEFLDHEFLETAIREELMVNDAQSLRATTPKGIMKIDGILRSILSPCKSDRV